MDFPPHTDKIMRPFLEAFGKCAKPKLEKGAAKIFNSIIISLYQDIQESQQMVIKKGCLQRQLITAKADFKQPEYDTKYFPASIRKYIKDNAQTQTNYKCKNIGGREINIYFTGFLKAHEPEPDQHEQEQEQEQHEHQQQQYVRQMYAWLSVCSKYANAMCAQTLDVYIYPTPFTKLLPANGATILSPEHVNTAFTTACSPQSQIIIFREEEWFKVFIHETFHSYGLDFASNNGMTEYVANLFPIQSDFSIYEAYTETWARIINCAFCSLANKASQTVFIENINFCLEMERMFAIYQCAKILGFMGLHYNNLHEAGSAHTTLRQNLYKENTHVFAYYVLTAIFLNDYPGFMLWCQTHNTKLIKFDESSENFKAFDAYIKDIYKCPSFQHGLEYMIKLNKQLVLKMKKHNELLNTTRMSIIHTV
jgi:hypothetical protein